MRVPADLPVPGTERLRLALDADLRLLAIADRLRRHWAAHAAATGLTQMQVKVLSLLEPGTAVPMRDLAAGLDYDASNLSTLADRLERRGLVERRPAPADRRVKALALTPDGERLRARFWSALTDDPGPLAALDTPALRTLTTILGALDTGAEPGAEARPASGA